MRNERQIASAANSAFAEGEHEKAFSILQDYLQDGAEPVPSNLLRIWNYLDVEEADIYVSRRIVSEIVEGTEFGWLPLLSFIQRPFPSHRVVLINLLKGIQQSVFPRDYTPRWIYSLSGEFLVFCLGHVDVLVAEEAIETLNVLANSGYALHQLLPASRQHIDDLIPSLLAEYEFFEPELSWGVECLEDAKGSEPTYGELLTAIEHWLSLHRPSLANSPLEGTVGGILQSLKRRGANAALYNDATGDVIQSVTVTDSPWADAHRIPIQTKEKILAIWRRMLDAVASIADVTDFDSSRVFEAVPAAGSFETRLELDSDEANQVIERLTSLLSEQAVLSGGKSFESSDFQKEVFRLLSLSSAGGFALEIDAYSEELRNHDLMIRIPERMARRSLSDWNVTENNLGLRTVRAELVSADRSGRGQFVIRDLDHHEEISGPVKNKKKLRGLTIGDKYRVSLQGRTESDARSGLARDVWEMVDVTDESAQETPSQPVERKPQTAKAPGTQTLRRWTKKLSPTEAQIPTSGSPVKILKLTQARAPIDFQSWFRTEFFVGEWQQKRTQKGILETLDVPFQVHFFNEDLGTVELHVDHADYRATKANPTTHIHWNDLLLAKLSSGAYAGAHVIIERDDKNKYWLTFAWAAPGRRFIGPKTKS